MKAGEVRAYAELIGILAILVSLALVGYEIRQTRLAIMGQTMIARAQLSGDSDQVYRESDFLTSIYLKYELEGLDSLTLVERETLATELNAAKYRFDAYFYQYELGLLPEDYYKYDILPNLASMRPFWEDFGLLSDETTRPTFKKAIETAPDITAWPADHWRQSEPN